MSYKDLSDQELMKVFKEVEEERLRRSQQEEILFALRREAAQANKELLDNFVISHKLIDHLKCNHPSPNISFNVLGDWDHVEFESLCPKCALTRSIFLYKQTLRLSPASVPDPMRGQIRLVLELKLEKV